MCVGAGAVDWPDEPCEEPAVGTEEAPGTSPGVPDAGTDALGGTTAPVPGTPVVPVAPPVPGIPLGWGQASLQVMTEVIVNVFV